MNTKTLEQFTTLTDAELSAVEGGGCNWRDADKAGVAGGLAAYGATCWW
ncbi:Blp family class II bacteriocin [Streptococcus sp. H49]